MRPDDNRVHLRTGTRDGAPQSNVVAMPTGSPPRHTAVPEDARHELSARHPEYPIECLCTHLYEPFQLTFARHAQQLFDERYDVELVASHQGLTIRAETEDAIGAALDVLTRFHGPQIRVGPPTIRYHDGVTLEEPWMGLRIRCAAEHLEAIRTDLIVRDAAIESHQTLLGKSVIHARARLAYLIGYSAALARITSGSAQCAMWLSHYAPAENSPPDGDAA